MRMQRTCDALVAGVPVLTRIGNSFARTGWRERAVCSGTSGIDHHTAEEYEALALKLAGNPAMLKAVHDKLARNRLTSAAVRYSTIHAQSRKRLYHDVERHSRGEPPESFAIVEPAAS
jgi:predicted O-linked N-acetylglucosamine transferase (SPINDLY family)